MAEPPAQLSEPEPLTQSPEPGEAPSVGPERRDDEAVLGIDQWVVTRWLWLTFGIIVVGVIMVLIAE